MSHKKTFISKQGPPAGGPYSTAVEYGGLVFLSGIGPADPKSGAMERGGIEAATRRVLDNIAIVLQEVGLTLQDVLKTNVYLADMDDFNRFNEVYRTYMGPDFPARTTIQAGRLPGDILVEIEVVAGRPQPQ